MLAELRLLDYFLPAVYFPLDGYHSPSFPNAVI